MQDTIKSLWNGIYKPANQDVEHSEREKEILRLLEEHERELIGKMDKETIKLFEKYNAIKALYDNHRLESAFAKGFSTGMKITYEAINKEPEL